MSSIHSESCSGLAIAQRQHTLYRNFQGYSTHADCDLIGFGTTSIGKIGHSYSQNVKGIDDYYRLVDDGHIPVFRGVELDQDDILRRDIITRLICHFELDIRSISHRYGLDFGDYFASELADLKRMQNDGLLMIREDRLRVLPRGRLLIRNICMVFDRYLHAPSSQRYSKVI